VIAAPQLASIDVPAPRRATPHRLLVLHGIYGRGRNWTTLTSRFVKHCAAWSALLVDLRLHGSSPDFAPPHLVSTAAADIASFERATDWHATAVMGHSFGGKVALAHASGGHDHLEQVWVIDSTPEARPPRGSAWRMLDVVGSLPQTFASRAEATAGLQAAGYTRAVAAWMASNLQYRDGHYAWRLDFQAMESLLRDFFATDYWQVVEAPPAGTVLHFVKARDSGVLSAEARRRIEAAGARHGRAFVHDVPGGHWVHTESPDALLALLTRHLGAAPLGC
jgi:pimeloyl-ACP methyl ester carboxylesterase